MTLDQALKTMSPQEFAFEIQRGGKVIVYQYVVSIVVMTFKRNAPVQFLKAGESAVVRGLPWTLLSLLAGWWGIPWGFIYTPQVLYKNLNGGVDVTSNVMARLAR
jgi:hypothetical protein